MPWLGSDVIDAVVDHELRLQHFEQDLGLGHIGPQDRLVHSQLACGAAHERPEQAPVHPPHESVGVQRQARAGRARAGRLLRVRRASPRLRRRAIRLRSRPGELRAAQAERLDEQHPVLGREPLHQVVLVSLQGGVPVGEPHTDDVAALKPWRIGHPRHDLRPEDWEGFGWGALRAPDVRARAEYRPRPRPRARHGRWCAAATRVRDVPSRPLRLAQQVGYKLGRLGFERQVVAPLLAARVGAWLGAPAGLPAFSCGSTSFPTIALGMTRSALVSERFERFHEILRRRACPTCWRFCRGSAASRSHLSGTDSRRSDSTTRPAMLARLASASG